MNTNFNWPLVAFMIAFGIVAVIVIIWGPQP